MRIRTTAAAVLLAAVGMLALGGLAHAQTDERDCEDVGTHQACEVRFGSGDARLGDAGAGDAGVGGAGAGDVGGSSTGPARQVSPVPRGGVDTGLDTARPVRSKPAPPAILLVAAFAVAGTAAAGAAAAAWVPAPAAAARRPVSLAPLPTPARGRVGAAPGRPQPPARPPLPVRARLGARDPEAFPSARVAA